MAHIVPKPGEEAATAQKLLADGGPIGYDTSGPSLAFVTDGGDAAPKKPAPAKEAPVKEATQGKGGGKK